MTEDERVSNLEETVAGMESKLNQILDTMTRLNQKCYHTPRRTTPNSAKTLRPFRLTWSTRPKLRRPKPATPPEFERRS